MSGIGFKLHRIINDSKKVYRFMDRKERKLLSRMGAFVRTTARQSIKSGGKKNKTSEPGEPPRSHTKLIKRIFFGVDSVSRSVVVGPVVVPGAKSRGAVDLEALEYGGSIIVAGESKKQKVQIEARPFMRPALAKETTPEKISAMWRSA